MLYIKRLLLLTICIITFGSATESVYLDYSLESITPQEILERQVDKNDNGFGLDTSVESYQPIIKTNKVKTNSGILEVKGYRSYSSKSAYY